MTAVIFWASLLFIVYAYFGYPLLLLIVSRFKTHPISKSNITPFVSFIITAHNEETRIQEKIENTLSQDYPWGQLEIIVASDCSRDGTDTIVRSFTAQGVKLVRVDERRGKEHAQKHAVEKASGQILVFSDVATRLDINGVRNIVKSFADPTVGCVSSVDKFMDLGGTMSGEELYIRYEMFLRNLESKVNTLVSLSGSFFAARKEVCEHWAADLQSDFNTLINAIRMGLRGVLDCDSVGYYKNISNEKHEFDRKVRTVVRGISVLMSNLGTLNPFRFGLFSWQLLSHKLCRWLVPFAMILVFVSNFILAFGSFFYFILLIFQFAFYFFALRAGSKSLLKTSRILKIPSFFVQVNLSILNAWYRYLRGERMLMWTPSQR
jgi:cellulose synthase/poly-beta-1,6-N-acetylglucosamine synthase-like glycosyltransferase